MEVGRYRELAILVDETLVDVAAIGTHPRFAGLVFFVTPRAWRELPVDVLALTLDTVLEELARREQQARQAAVGAVERLCAWMEETRKGGYGA